MGTDGSELVHGWQQAMRNQEFVQAGELLVGVLLKGSLACPHRSEVVAGRFKVSFGKLSGNA